MSAITAIPIAVWSLPDDDLVADVGVMYSTAVIMNSLWTCWFACNRYSSRGDGAGHKLRALDRSLGAAPRYGNVNGCGSSGGTG